MIILGTGAREWWEYDIIHCAIEAQIHRLPRRLVSSSVLRQGGARGADRMMAKAAKNLGLQVETYEPQWDVYGISAAFRRNEDMVNLRPPADVVITFALEWASGTGHCARYAREKGLRVIDYGVKTSGRARP